eukprot:2953642-Amphidinium_carterae.1
MLLEVQCSKFLLPSTLPPSHCFAWKPLACLIYPEMPTRLGVKAICELSAARTETNNRYR